VRFVADENVSHFVIQSLVDAGHDVVSVHDVKLTGARDDAIIQFGIEDGRVIVTHDRDFGGLLRYPTRESSGVMLIRLRLPSPKNVWKALKRALDTLDETRIQGRVVVIEDARIRVSGENR
jgi:predicted nuclease of predicted toxin-antitoxin system